MRSAVCAVLSSALGLLVALTGARTPAEAANSAGPKPPKTDVFDRFDDEQSPLQRAMLDARDSRWRGKAKLGPDPRCGRVVREFAREEGKPSPAHPRLCFNAAGEAIPQERCLQLYCCGDSGVACPEATCGQALIAGTDLSPCFDAGATPDACVERIYKKGAQPRVIDCLENPLDTNGELRSKCSALFEGCPSIPFLTSEKDSARSGVIKDSENREVGRRIQSRTVIHYDNAGQRRPHSMGEQADGGWDPIRIEPSRPASREQGVPGAVPAVGTVLSAATFNPGCDPDVRCPANDDGDCVDRANGRAYGPADCFDADHRLRRTLTFTSDPCPAGSVCCRHTGLAAGDATGEVFQDDDCLVDPAAGAVPENLRTTLVQKIDEDPFDALNNDGDCTDGTVVTSDCLDSSGGLRAGFRWNVDEEICDGANQDQDCLNALGKVGMLREGRCLDEHGVVIGETPGVDFIDRIDEDCPETAAGADTLDNDRDGAFGEDPPNSYSAAGAVVRRTTRTSDSSPGAVDGGMAPASSPPVALRSAATDDERACRALFAQVGDQVGVALEPDAAELPGGGRSCDLTRLARVHANWNLARPGNEANREEFRRRSGRDRIFDVDSRGRWCGTPGADACSAEAGNRGAIHPDNAHDPRDSGGHGKSYRYEERRVTLDEVFAVKCKPVRDESAHRWVPTRYDEVTGTCVRIDSDASPEFAAAGTTVAGETCEEPICRQAMMGFTFAPPVLEWGWRVREDICVFGICVEMFYARIGYEFDLAAGVRLPVEVQFDGVPDSVLAAGPLPTIQAGLQPLDFTADQFRAFCAMHRLDRSWYISDCDRFSFPDFLDSSDGDEFVARYSIFAGIIVRLFYIPVINYGIDSGIDVPAMCTLWKMKDGIEGMSLAELARIALGLADGTDALKVLKENFANCGSFTTPFGFESCDPADPTSCPPTGKKLRGWPFLNLSKWIRADCFDATLHGEVVTVGGQPVPLCTGLVLGTAGASLGVGLGVEANAGSLLIKADWSGQGDASAAGGTLRFETSLDDPSPGDRACHAPISGVTADNRAEQEADGHFEDHAVVALDDFTYFLNALELTLLAKLEFGGILSPIPDIASFRLYSFVFDTTRLGWDGIPIPQHPDTAPVELKIPVENYGLALDLAPDAPRPARPGCAVAGGPGERCPDYEVRVTNLGSFPDSFDHFRFELSNRPDIAGCPRALRTDPNNDGDCLVAGVPHRGNPFDGLADDCYDACGTPLAGADPMVGEDPAGCLGDTPCRTAEEMDDDHDGFVDEDGPEDAWSAAWLRAGQPVLLPAVSDLLPHTQQGDSIQFRVSPLAHPFTRPGVYPFRMWADSMQARAKSLPPVDPCGNRRVDAPVDGTLEVIAFFDPRLSVLPDGEEAEPGDRRGFRIDAVNGANTPDTLALLTRFVDSNTAQCGLTVRGRQAGCPYRADATAIPPEWLEGTPPEALGPLDPSQLATAGFAVRIPSDWAGMQDTVYRFELTSTSTSDPDRPPATRTARIDQTVKATLESRARYIGLEIGELIGEIEKASVAGLPTAGLLPFATRPVQLAHQRAMDRLAGGDPRGATQALNTLIRTTTAFLYALGGSGGKLPAAIIADWNARGEAILADLDVTTGGGSFRAVEPLPENGRKSRPAPSGGSTGRSRGDSLR